MTNRFEMAYIYQRSDFTDEEDEPFLPKWTEPIWESTKAACLATSTMLAVLTPACVCWGLYSNQKELTTIEKLSVGVELAVMVLVVMQSHLRNLRFMMIPEFALSFACFAAFSAVNFLGILEDQHFRYSDCFCRRTFISIVPIYLLVILAQHFVLLWKLANHAKSMERLFEHSGRFFLLHAGVSSLVVYACVVAVILISDPVNVLCLFLQTVGLFAIASIYLVVWMIISPSTDDFLEVDENDDAQGSQHRYDNSLVVSFACNCIAFAILFEHFIKLHFLRFFLELLAEIALFHLTVEAVIHHFGNKCFNVFRRRDTSA